MSTHRTVAIGTLVAIAAIGIALAMLSPSAAPTDAREMMLTVEHSLPFGLSVTVSSGGSLGFLELGHDAPEQVAVTLPSCWERHLVRHVPLDTVTSDITDEGMRRWVLPIGSSVVYRCASRFAGLRVANRSAAPFKILVTRVNLTNDTTETDTLLVKDLPVTVW